MTSRRAVHEEGDAVAVGGVDGVAHDVAGAAGVEGGRLAVDVEAKRAGGGGLWLAGTQEKKEKKRNFS